MDIGYDVKTNPSSIGVQMGISVDNKTVRATIKHINDFGFSLSPNGGGIGGDILSGIAWPVATIIANALSGKVIDAIKGTQFDVVTIPDIPFSVSNVNITISPSHLSLSNFNQSLLIAGDVDIR